MKGLQTSLKNVENKVLIPNTLTNCVYDSNGERLSDILDNFEAKRVKFDNKNVDIQSTNVQGALEEVFQSVSNGKEKIASAITDKGVETKSDATFDEMSNNIRDISVGGKDSETIHNEFPTNIKEFTLQNRSRNETLFFDNGLDGDTYLTIVDDEGRHGVFYDDSLGAPIIMDDIPDHPPIPYEGTNQDYIGGYNVWGYGRWGDGYHTLVKTNYIEHDSTTGEQINERMGILITKSYPSYAMLLRIPLKEKAFKVKSITFEGIHRNDGAGNDMFYVSFGGFITKRNQSDGFWNKGDLGGNSRDYREYSCTINNDYNNFLYDTDEKILQGLEDKSIYLCLYRDADVNTIWNIITKITVKYFD